MACPRSAPGWQVPGDNAVTAALTVLSPPALQAIAVSSSPDKISSGAGTRASLAPAGTGRASNRRPGAKSVLAALAGLALLVPACSTGSPAAGTAGHALTTQGSTLGARQRQGGGLSGTPSRNQSGGYSGTFSVAFARCMRAHGVHGFPDPDGKPDQVSGSGIDPHSAIFQAALYGPCKSLAPAGWVSAPPLGPPPTGTGS